MSELAFYLFVRSFMKDGHPRRLFFFFFFFFTHRGAVLLNK